MSGVKRLWSKLRASDNTLSLIFNYREIDQNSGNSPNVSIPKIPIDKILLYHAQQNKSFKYMQQVSLKRLKIRKYMIEKFKEKILARSEAVKPVS